MSVFFLIHSESLKDHVVPGPAWWFKTDLLLNIELG